MSIFTNHSKKDHGKREGSPLFWKLSRALLVLLTCLGLVLVAVFLYFHNRVTYQIEQILGWSTAELLAVELAPHLADGADLKKINKTIGKYLLSNPNLDVYLLNDLGEIIADFGQTEPIQRKVVDIQPILSFINNTDRLETPIFGDDPRVPTETSLDLPTKVIFSAAPVKIGKKMGYVYVSLQNKKYRMQSREFQFRLAVKGFLLGLVLTLFGTSAAGFYLFYRLIGRFRKMTDIVVAYEQGDFSKRVTEGGNEECDTLSKTINQMAEAIVTNMQQLKAKDALRRELIANVSHDLRKPVAVISGFSEIMLTQVPDLREESRKLCEVIYQSADSLNQLLAELFELAKFEAREMQPDWQEFSLVELFDDVFAEYGEEAKKRGILFKVDVPENNSLVVSGDVMMIGRVLSSLVEHAIKNTKSDELLLNGSGASEYRKEADTNVVPSYLLLTAQFKAEGVLVSVDLPSGNLTVAQAMPTVPGRYQELQSTANGQGSLSGLGLAIIKKILEVHNSSIVISPVGNNRVLFSFMLNCNSHNLI